MINYLKQKTYQFLRRSEKWTHTDMVYLAKGGFWLTGNKIVGSITAFALAIAYANLLPKETYGLYKYVLSISSLLIIATLPGMNTAVIRSVALGRDGVIKAAVKAKTKWGLLSIIAGLILSGYYFINNNPVLGTCFLIVAIIHPLIEARFVYGAYLGGKKLFKYSAIYSSIFQISLTVILLVVLLFHPGAIHLILVYFLTVFFLHFFLNTITFKKYPPNKKKDPEAILFGKHLSLMSILGAISDQFDKILMWHFLGPVHLAVYAFAILPVDQIKNIARSIVPMAMPKLTTQSGGTLKKTLPPKLLKFSAILLIPMVFYVLLSPYLFKIIFPEYIASIQFTKIYALSLLLFPLRLFGTAITAHAKKKYLYILKTVQPLIKIILLIILLPIFGILGAVAALIFSSIINGILSYLFFKKI